jgi:hypothetical protein
VPYWEINFGWKKGHDLLQIGGEMFLAPERAVLAQPVASDLLQVKPDTVFFVGAG